MGAEVVLLEGHGEIQRRDGHTISLLQAQASAGDAKQQRSRKLPVRKRRPICLLSSSGHCICPFSAVLIPEPARKIFLSKTWPQSKLWAFTGRPAYKLGAAASRLGEWSTV